MSVSKQAIDVKAYFTEWVWYVTSCSDRILTGPWECLLASRRPLEALCPPWLTFWTFAIDDSICCLGRDLRKLRRSSSLQACLIYWLRWVRGLLLVHLLVTWARALASRIRVFPCRRSLQRKPPRLCPNSNISKVTPSLPGADSLFIFLICLISSSIVGTCSVLSLQSLAFSNPFRRFSLTSEKQL